MFLLSQPSQQFNSNPIQAKPTNIEQQELQEERQKEKEKAKKRKKVKFIQSINYYDHAGREQLQPERPDHQSSS